MAKYYQKFRLGSKVRYTTQYEKYFDTTVVAYDSSDDTYLIFSDVPNCLFRGMIFQAKDYTSSCIISLPEKQIEGHLVDWAGPKYLSLLNQPALDDGLYCVRCGLFSDMAEPNIKHLEKGSGLACYSCRDSESWWFRSNDWAKM